MIVLQLAALAVIVVGSIAIFIVAALASGVRYALTRVDDCAHPESDDERVDELRRIVTATARASFVTQPDDVAIAFDAPSPARYEPTDRDVRIVEIVERHGRGVFVTGDATVSLLPHEFGRG